MELIEPIHVVTLVNLLKDALILTGRFSESFKWREIGMLNKQRYIIQKRR